LRLRRDGGYDGAVRLLGIDFGARRIGLAITDPSATLARPYRVLERGRSDQVAIAQTLAVIDELVREEDGLALVVVGLPTSLDGGAHEQTRRVQVFVGNLQARAPVPVVVQDERLTSREAESRLAVTERDWRRRKAQLDAAAAAVILQDYIDQHRSELEGGQ